MDGVGFWEGRERERAGSRGGGRERGCARCGRHGERLGWGVSRGRGGDQEWRDHRMNYTGLIQQFGRHPPGDQDLIRELNDAFLLRPLARRCSLVHSQTGLQNWPLRRPISTPRAFYHISCFIHHAPIPAAASLRVWDAPKDWRGQRRGDPGQCARSPHP
jgi:hypothetical protein